MPHYVPEEVMNDALQSPKICAEEIRKLTEDMCILIAMVSGPEATKEKHEYLIRRIAQDLQHGSAIAHKRLVEACGPIIITGGGTH